MHDFQRVKCIILFYLEKDTLGYEILWATIVITTIKVTPIEILLCGRHCNKNGPCEVSLRFDSPVIFEKVSDVKGKLSNPTVSIERRKFLFHFPGKTNKGGNVPPYLCLIFPPS